jgi:hypothetical protein
MKSIDPDKNRLPEIFTNIAANQPIAAFQKMLADSEYQKATYHRSAALDDARLVATLETDPFR